MLWNRGFVLQTHPDHVVVCRYQTAYTRCLHCISPVNPPWSFCYIQVWGLTPLACWWCVLSIHLDHVFVHRCQTLRQTLGSGRPVLWTHLDCLVAMRRCQTLRQVCQGGDPVLWTHLDVVVFRCHNLRQVLQSAESWLPFCCVQVSTLTLGVAKWKTCPLNTLGHLFVVCRCQILRQVLQSGRPVLWTHLDHFVVVYRCQALRHVF